MDREEDLGQLLEQSAATCAVQGIGCSASGRVAAVAVAPTTADGQAISTIALLSLPDFSVVRTLQVPCISNASHG